jgi:hypothetical protein
MTVTTRNDIKSLIYYMKCLYPNYNPVLEGQVNTVDALYDQLGDLDLDLLKLGVTAACGELGRAFAPSAGEIRGAVIDMHTRASGLPDAAEAWGAVLQYFKDRSELPAFQHPVTQEAVGCMGGLSAIGMSDNQVADRAHFLKIFDQVRGREIDRAATLPAVQKYIQQTMADLSHQLSDGKEAQNE